MGKCYRIFLLEATARIFTLSSSMFSPKNAPSAKMASNRNQSPAKLPEPGSDNPQIITPQVGKGRKAVLEVSVALYNGGGWGFGLHQNEKRLFLKKILREMPRNFHFYRLALQFSYPVFYSLTNAENSQDLWISF
jgi:hypothetical protein